MEKPIGLKLGHFLDLKTLLAISHGAEEFPREVTDDLKSFS